MPLLTLQDVPNQIARTYLRYLNAQIEDRLYNLGIVAENSVRLICAPGGAVMSSAPIAPNTINLHPNGLITVAFETAPCPQNENTLTDDGVNVKRIAVRFMGDRCMLPPRTRIITYFPMRNTAVDYPGISKKIVELSEMYRNGVLTIQTRATEAEAIKNAALIAEAKIEARKKEYKATEAQRESMYDELVASLDGFGKIESEVKGGYINLQLENDIRVKVAVDANRVFITEIDTPAYFDRGNINKVLAYLQKVSKL